MKHLIVILFGVLVASPFSQANRIKETMEWLVQAGDRRNYLERKDGKRIFLQVYHPPSPDGLGAKFIFSRDVDGAPFLMPKVEK